MSDMLGRLTSRPYVMFITFFILIFAIPSAANEYDQNFLQKAIQAIESRSGESYNTEKLNLSPFQTEATFGSSNAHGKVQTQFSIDTGALMKRSRIVVQPEDLVMDDGTVIPQEVREHRLHAQLTNSMGLMKIGELADGNGDFSRALGLTMDGTGFGMGERSQRFSVVLENGVVKELNVEEPGAFDVSSAEHMLGQL